MLHSIEEALVDLKQGKMIIVIDDEQRENEGDLLIPAQFATPEIINFMATHGRGLICMPIEKDMADKLQLYPMVNNNSDTFYTAFTQSIDAIEATTGISAYERSLTIQKVLRDDVTFKDFKKPGHVFPLIAKDGGVRMRAGHTEAAVDFAKLIGSKGAGVICEIMNDDGTMARLNDLIPYATKHQLKIVSIADLITYLTANNISI